MKKQFADIKTIEWKDGRIVNLSEINLDELEGNVVQQVSEESNAKKREREEKDEDDDEEDGLFELADEFFGGADNGSNNNAAAAASPAKTFSSPKSKDSGVCDLSIGAIRKMARNLPCIDPVVQVLSVDIDKDTVVVSDGSCFLEAKITPVLTKKFASEEDKDFARFCVAKAKFSSMKVMGQRSVLILDLAILRTSDGVIGEPSHYDEKESEKKVRAAVAEPQKEEGWKRMYYEKNGKKSKVWVSTESLGKNLMIFRYSKKMDAKEYSASAKLFSEEAEEEKEEEEEKEKEKEKEKEEEEEDSVAKKRKVDDKVVGKEKEEQEQEVVVEQMMVEEEEEGEEKVDRSLVEKYSKAIHGMEGDIADLIQSLTDSTSLPRNVVIHALFVNSCWADATFEYLTCLDDDALAVKPWSPEEDLSIFMHLNCLNLLDLPGRSKQEMAERSNFLTSALTRHSNKKIE